MSRVARPTPGARRTAPRAVPGTGVVALLALIALLVPGARPVPAQELPELKAQLEAEKEKPYADRVKTIMAVGMLQSDEAATVLEKLLGEGQDESIQVAAVYALAACGSPQSVKKLRAIVRDEAPPSRVRCGALDALLRIRPLESFELFASVARDDRTDYAVKVAAYTAIARFPLEQTEAIWRAALSQGSPPVRVLAFKALAPLKDRAVLQEARKALESQNELAEVRAAAVAPWKAAAGPEGTRLLIAVAAKADAALRGAIGEAFATLTNENDISLLFPPLTGHADPTVRMLIAGALGKLNHPGVVASLEGALRDKDLEVRLAAIESLGDREEKRAEELLQREATGSVEETSMAAIGALAGRASEESLKLLSRLAENSRLSVRVAAIDALGTRPPADALPILEKAVRNTNWSVRAAAIRALGKHKTRETIDLLVERLGQEDGRLRGDIVDILRVLTGRHMTYDPVTWREWWKPRRDAYDPSAPSEREGGGDVNTVAYYGVPVLSKRIVFCLDMSSSMSAFGEGGDSRLDQAKKELIRTLAALGAGVNVNLIFFDDRIEPWRSSLAPIKGSLPSAQAVINRVKPRGSTNIYDTLEAAFTDPTVDTVFLLSDGEPTDGKYVSTEEILRRIRRVNRARQVVIHTISLGKSDFMKTLAEQNGGRYVEKP
jgi:HEAT repeat protein